MNKSLEKKIKKIALKYLEHGRDKKWDIPHTLRTVIWMKNILKEENGDNKILVTAAYLHDVGYHKLFSKKIADFKNVKYSKKMHMKNGAAIVKKELKKTKSYSREEIREISHLVMVHDSLKKIKTKNEFLLMEADSLSMSDVKIVTSGYDAKNWMIFYNKFKKERVPLFKTKTSKDFLKPLLKEADKYYEIQKKLLK